MTILKEKLNNEGNENKETIKMMFDLEKNLKAEHSVPQDEISQLSPPLSNKSICCSVEVVWKNKSYRCCRRHHHHQPNLNNQVFQVNQKK